MGRIANAIAMGIGGAILGAIVWWGASMSMSNLNPQEFILGGCVLGFFVGAFGV